MKITRRQLRSLIREALEIYHAPEEAYDYIDTFPEEYSNLDKTNITKDEAFSAGCSVCGSQARDDCNHKEDFSMLKPDDPDLDDDGFLSVAELVSMVHNMTDDIHEQADRNRDGTLDADELRALADDIEDEVPQIDMRLVNSVMDYIEDHYNKARFDGRYIVGIAPATGPDGRPTQDIKKFDAAVSKRTLMRNVRNWLGY